MITLKCELCNKKSKYEKEEIDKELYVNCKYCKGMIKNIFYIGDEL